MSKRKAIIAHCRALNSSGLNQGTSGNISIRHQDGMLISPTSRPYDSLQPEDIAFVDQNGKATGKFAPSSEWHFHLDILLQRPDVNAVVHAHPTYCTTLAIMGKEIPPIHYMIAAFGGATIRCAPYEIYGTAALSKVAVAALEGRKGCLLAHHGMITVGQSIEQAFWLAGELEALARQYHGCLVLGEPPLLSDEQIEEVLEKISGYGQNHSS
ncbi:class II aldolase/adducin family protein [Ruegeria sp. HKCCD7255]|uniref:class II aldolase/adducin family protein n=1 Tax=Ruegeria sp. HKCCD7255 TaxID=2683004 RepID=UPI001489AD3C|nr:class II aldolase/adducin family protein [Ruegeria sp. HKCCD7255]